MRIVKNKLEAITLVMWYWEVAAELENGERYVNLDWLAACGDPIDRGQFR